MPIRTSLSLILTALLGLYSCQTSRNNQRPSKKERESEGKNPNKSVADENEPSSPKGTSSPAVDQKISSSLKKPCNIGPVVVQAQGERMSRICSESHLIGVFRVTSEKMGNSNFADYVISTIGGYANHYAQIDGRWRNVSWKKMLDERGCSLSESFSIIGDEVQYRFAFSGNSNRLLQAQRIAVDTYGNLPFDLQKVVSIQHNSCVLAERLLSRDIVVIHRSYPQFLDELSPGVIDVIQKLADNPDGLAEFMDKNDLNALWLSPNSVTQKIEACIYVEGVPEGNTNPHYLTGSLTIGKLAKDTDDTLDSQLAKGVLLPNWVDSPTCRKAP